MISYRQDGLKPFKITVKLSGKVVGHIKREDNLSGYYYQPKGSATARGPAMPSVQAVKASIERGE